MFLSKQTFYLFCYKANIVKQNEANNFKKTLCLCRTFVIPERCLGQNPERYLSNQASYELNHRFPYLVTHLPN
jgi:hypothetical protein